MINLYQGNTDIAKKQIKESLNLDPDNVQNQKYLKLLNKI